MNKLILPLVLMCLSGCVTTGKYKALESQAQGEKLRAAGLEEQLQASKKETEGLRQQLEAGKVEYMNSSRQLQDQLGESQAKVKGGAEELASVKTRVSSLEDSNKDLRQSLEANKGELTKKVSDLTKDKDILAKKFSDATSELASVKASKEAETSALQRKLDLAVADRKAMEAVKSARIADLTAQLGAAAEEKGALERAKEEEVARVKGSFEQLAAGLKAEIAAGEIQLTQLKGKLTVNMVDRILFDSGESMVKPDGRKVLNNIAKVLKGVADKDIRIEGHTDNVPIGGELKNRFATNWELSTARATAVARYLQDSAKLEPARLVATGYGEYRPVAPNDKPENKALNRRIEIVLVPKE
ncbi:MAG: OmpA family protein [Elusimicrobia bacterium]|nr:OmpA family protein [Elusimicrobiota bacterium]